MQLIDDLKSVEFYTRDKKEIDVFSASEISTNEPLQGYLMRTCEPMNSGLSQATLGSIFDAGMRSLVIDGKLGSHYKSGERIQTVINGVKVSGEPDIIDTKNKVIYDVKLTKLYALKMIIKDVESHNYTKQLNIYNYLLGGGYDLRLFVALKDQKDFDPKETFNAIEDVAVTKYSKEKVEQMVTSYADKVNDMLSGGELPRKCDETFGNDLKCRFFCSYMNSCSYGKKYKTLDSVWGL